MKSPNQRREGINMRRQKSVFIAVVSLLTLTLSPFVFANIANAQEPASRAGLSHARVVSLTLVAGTVLARKPGVTKWTHATLNTPVEEGVSVATAAHSFAEVQFENGSTVRLGELSRLDFVQLALAPPDGRVNHLTLYVGLATVNVVPGRHDDFVLNASGAGLTPCGKTEFRTDVNHGRLRVEVFRGHIQAADSNQSEKFGKNHVLAYDRRAGGAFQVTAPIEMDDWDKWVQARDREASLAEYGNQVSSVNGLYGWDDLIPFGGMGNLPSGFGDDGF
jgi:ferric-dicitrate binding protein FerR (iron transport regulator)